MHQISKATDSELSHCSELTKKKFGYSFNKDSFPLASQFCISTSELFPLNRAGRLAGDVQNHTVHTFHLIDNAIGNGLH